MPYLDSIFFLSRARKIAMHEKKRHKNYHATCAKSAKTGLLHGSLLEIAPFLRVLLFSKAQKIEFFKVLHKIWNYTKYDPFNSITNVPLKKMSFLA